MIETLAVVDVSHQIESKLFKQIEISDSVWENSFTKTTFTLSNAISDQGSMRMSVNEAFLRSMNDINFSAYCGSMCQMKKNICSVFLLDQASGNCVLGLEETTINWGVKDSDTTVKIFVEAEMIGSLMKVFQYFNNFNCRKHRC